MLYMQLKPDNTTRTWSSYRLYTCTMVNPEDMITCCAWRCCSTAHLDSTIIFHLHSFISKETYIVEFRVAIKLHPIIRELSVHVGRLPVAKTVAGGSHKDDPAVAAGRGSGEDDRQQLQRQQKVAEVIHLWK